jgi:enoyl-CoA hydratase
LPGRPPPFGRRTLTVHLQRHGDLGHLVLEHPPANVLQDPVFVDPSRLAAFLAQPDLRGLVVTGAGRHFCGGADLETLRERLPDAASLSAALDRGKALLALLADAPVPVVAAIRGRCLGAGLEIALACHARVAAEGAMLGFPEATLGLLPGLGGTVGDGEPLARRARVELVLSARLVGADEARVLGLVDRVVPTGDEVAAATTLLRSWTDGRSPLLVRSVLESVANARRLPRDRALARETELFLGLAREVAS